MITYAVMKPIEEYDVTLDSGNVFGLYNSYGHLPSLLALIMIGTPLPYDYEGDKPKEQRQVEIKNIDPLKITLHEEIQGATVEKLLKTLTPIEFYQAIEDEDIAHLTLVKEVFKGDDKPFKLVVGARAAVWGMNYRGKIKSDGNIVKVSFGDNSVNVPDDMIILHEALLGRITNG